ncbi:MAG: Mrp/NBP35 family ATP-binding protein [Corynebacterium sp.]|nr:Mrp/NBP35 family ATP-binding protein [Corynebacterium sp.]
MSSALSKEIVLSALARVEDPEIGRPITELNMVDNVEIEDNNVRVKILLTIAGCPLRDTISTNVRAALADISGIGTIDVELAAMTEEQRRALKSQLRGGSTEPEIPFAQPNSTTRVYAVASGKGGVGKSSMTVNLAAALQRQGLKVGIVDADIYGHSIPTLLGSTQGPTVLDDEMLLPPIAHDIKHISIGQFVQGNAPVVWRGPMLHRALQQFLADVFWGDLDVLLLDLPPGTGDVALSVAQLIPNAELLVVTTPQTAAAEVAERAGSIAQQTRQRVAGVIENMAAMIMPDGNKVEIFGSGGGEVVSNRLSTLLGYDVPLLGQVPLEPALRENGDAGVPVVLADASAPASREIESIATKLKVRRDSLAGKPLGLGVTPH